MLFYAQYMSRVIVNLKKILFLSLFSTIIILPAVFILGRVQNKQLEGTISNAQESLASISPVPLPRSNPHCDIVKEECSRSDLHWNGHRNAIEAIIELDYWYGTREFSFPYYCSSLRASNPGIGGTGDPFCDTLHELWGRIGGMTLNPEKRLLCKLYLNPNAEQADFGSQISRCLDIEGSQAVYRKLIEESYENLKKLFRDKYGIDCDTDQNSNPEVCHLLETIRISFEQSFLDQARFCQEVNMCRLSPPTTQLELVPSSPTPQAIITGFQNRNYNDSN